MTTWGDWTADQVAGYLKGKVKGLADDCDAKFRDHKITGANLQDITKEKLRQMGFSVGERQKIKCAIMELTGQLGSLVHMEGKVINDHIHGHISLHPLCVKIVDTPQFQRLRHLLQLGACYYVFPGASHRRFEHSIGVAHLARRLAEELQRRQPELEITEKDVLCVQIAGLCHDLGHGPFSHTFDNIFIRNTRPDKKWKHEDGSEAMFKHLVEKNNLKGEFEKYGLTEVDRKFILELIRGVRKERNEAWTMEGRGEDKSFLYEIVANKRTGIDVDKWDYFARDCLNLGIRNNFDHNRFMAFARVLDVDGELQICSREKEVENIYGMFHTRKDLHKSAYQHKTSNIIELMITEAMELVNDFVEIEGEGGKPRKMSECIDDMEAYTRLHDGIYHQILYSTDMRYQPARAILERIECRDLYKCVAQTQPINPVTHKICDEKEIVRKITELSKEEFPLEGKIVANKVVFDFGMKDRNPIEQMRFYRKSAPDEPRRIVREHASLLLPEIFSEVVVRLYCKTTDEKTVAAAKKYFERWCISIEIEEFMDTDLMSTPFTPVHQPSHPVLPLFQSNNTQQRQTADF